jgi:TonB family protein
MASARGLLFLLTLTSALPARAQHAHPPTPSATVSVESFTGAITASDVAELPTHAGAGVTRCATQRTATIVTDETTFELAIDTSGHVATATVMGAGDIIVDEARTRWLACATQALRHTRFPPHDTASTVSVRVRWSSGSASRGGERATSSGALSGRRSRTFDHAIETRPSTTRTEAPVAYSRDELRRVAGTHAAEVRHCYETELVAHPGMDGTILLAFTIQPDGSVTGATAREDQPHVAALTTCVITAVQRWTFPPPETGVATEVTYPFVFRMSH